MRTEKAIKNIQFIKAGYENLMENDPERIMAVGEGINCEAEIKTKGDLYAHFVESLTMAEAALEELRLYNMGKMCLVPAEVYEKQCKELDELKEKQLHKRFPYVEGQRAEIFHDGKWHKGVIRAGYRFCDGIVTVETDGGRVISCGEARKELYRPLDE